MNRCQGLASLVRNGRSIQTPAARIVWVHIEVDAGGLGGVVARFVSGDLESCAQANDRTINQGEVWGPTDRGFSLRAIATDRLHPQQSYLWSGGPLQKLNLKGELV